MLNKKLHIYNSLDTLKILTFWKILQDKNIFLLDFDYYEGKKYSKKSTNEIEVTWSRLYDEYFILREDIKATNDLRKAFDKLSISSEILDITNNYNFLIKLKSFETYLPKEDFLRHEQNRYKKLTEIHPKVKLKYFEGIDVNLAILKKVLSAMQNTYNLYHKKLDNKIKHEIKEVHNVYDQVTNMEEWIGKDHIPIEDVVVAKWLSYEKLRNKKIKDSRKNGE